MTYTYYDYLEGWYDDYYEYYYWPYYYGVYNGSNSTYNGTYPPSPWEQPYPMDIFNPIFGVISISGAPLSVLLAAYIFYQIYTKRNAGKIKSSKLTLVLTVSSILLHVIWCITDATSYSLWYLDWKGPEQAEIADIIWNVFWCASKISLYLAFMNRYYNIFRAATTMDAAGIRKKYILFGSFSVAILAQIVLLAVFVFYYNNKDIDYDKARRIYLNTMWAFLAVDILLIATIGYLLNRAILKLVVTAEAIDRVSNWRPSTGGLSVQSSTQKEQTTTKTEADIEEDDEVEMYESKGHVASHSVSTPMPLSPEAGRSVTATSPDPDEKPLQSPSTPKSAAEKKKKKKAKKKSATEKLVDLTTRIALMCIISMSSSFVYQLVWNIAEELENYDIKWFTYTWTIDSLINIVCIYLSLGIAEKDYTTLCEDGTCVFGQLCVIPCKLCQCHGCCKACIERIAEIKTQGKVRKITEQMEENEKASSTAVV